MCGLLVSGLGLALVRLAGFVFFDSGFGAGGFDGVLGSLLRPSIAGSRFIKTA